MATSLETGDVICLHGTASYTDTDARTDGVRTAMEQHGSLLRAYNSQSSPSQLPGAFLYARAKSRNEQRTADRLSVGEPGTVLLIRRPIATPMPIAAPA